MLRDEKPVLCPAIQFAGGEPTMREDIARIIRIANEFVFTQVQMATNGIKLANSLEFCKELYAAGLDNRRYTNRRKPKLNNASE